MEESRNQELLAMRQQNVPIGPYNITPIFVKEAKGALLRDIEGKEYIDFSGGIGVQNLGHNAETVVSAIKEQVGQFVHTCFHVAMYESYIRLAKRLNDLTPGSFPKKTFFVNSGAEAVENAVKIARYSTKRQGIIAFQNAYHGRTYMALSLTSQAMPYKRGFGPFCPEVYRIPYAYCYRCPYKLTYPDCDLTCANGLEDILTTQVSPDAVAAVILEPVQGEGGFIAPPPEYLARIKNICEKYEILMIADEIQTGMGRTGKLFACEHFGVAPDILLTGKSLAGGLPLAGVTGRADVMDASHVGGLGGTFAGNPVACSAGLSILELLNSSMLDRASKLGEKLRRRFLALQDRYEAIGDVRGLGPMLGMEIVKDRGAKVPDKELALKVIKSAFEKGLIILSCGVYGNCIRTLIPFTITDDQLNEGLDIIERSFSEAASG